MRLRHVTLAQAPRHTGLASPGTQTRCAHGWPAGSAAPRLPIACRRAWVPPLALVRLVGWPLPTTIPSFGEIEQAVRIGIEDMVVVKALAILAWLIWAQVALSVVWETAAAIRAAAMRCGQATAASSGPSASPMRARCASVVSSPSTAWKRGSCTPETM